MLKFLASPSMYKTLFGSLNSGPLVLRKTAGKPDAGMLVRERIVTSILKKSPGSPNWFSFLTVPGGKANKSAVLICSSAFLVRLAS